MTCDQNTNLVNAFTNQHVTATGDAGDNDTAVQDELSLLRQIATGQCRLLADCFAGSLPHWRSHAQTQLG